LDGDINIKIIHNQEIKARIPQVLDDGLISFSQRLGISKAGLIRLLLSASINIKNTILKSEDEEKEYLGASQTIRIDSSLYEEIDKKAKKLVVLFLYIF
jgi:hypothetical protein